MVLWTLTMSSVTFFYKYANCYSDEYHSAKSLSAKSYSAKC